MIELHRDGPDPYAAYKKFVISRDHFTVFPQAGDMQFNCLSGVRDRFLYGLPQREARVWRASAVLNASEPYTGTPRGCWTHASTVSVMVL